MSTITTATDNAHLVKHQMRTWIDEQGKPQAFCNCGAGADPATILRHVKASRRWRYLGAEVHYGYRYHIWEHQLTGRRWAIEGERYAGLCAGAR